MKYILLAALIFSTSCAVRAPNWPFPDQKEMLEYCWKPGDQKSYWPEECAEGEGYNQYVQWKQLPITVTSNDAMAGISMDAVRVWNEWLGFELFEFSPYDMDADVTIWDGGDSAWLMGLASHWRNEQGELRGGIFIYSNAKDSLSTYVHEIGHILGLAHDPDNWLSVMYPTDRRSLPTLEAKDRAVLRRYYFNILKNQ